MDEIINPPTLDAGLKHALLEPISIALNRPIWVRLPPISSTSSPTVGVRVGTTTPSVEENQDITPAVIEAMKMETSVVARMSGTVDQILVTEGTSVKAGELLITIQ